MRRRELLLLGAAARLPGQTLETQARALRPADTSRRQAAVLDEIEARARAALASIRHARIAAEADGARAALRRRLEYSLGFRKLPWPPRGNASITGVVPRDGYRIDKVAFEGLPGSRVPAHVYLPERRAGKAPGILFYNGHWWPDSKSRPDFQAFCINMARWGFVVLSFDPFGQGERGVSSRDHRRTELLLGGVSQQGVAVYESRCALEYLLSREEVDRERIGMTGASGGGYNTWMMAALDDRIQAAVPVVGTSDFFEQIQVTRELDWYAAAEHCHFVPGLIRYADNHELLAMIAPRPLLIVSASVDQSFPVTGVRAVHAYGESLYGSYGEPSKIAYFEDTKEGHGYQKAKREAAYGWFLRHLAGRGDGRPIAEPRTETLPFDAPELRCFVEGKQAAGRAMITAAERLVSRGASSAERLRQRMGPEPVAPEPEPLPPSTARVERHTIASEAGIEIPGLLLQSGASAAVGTVIAIDDRGKEALASDAVIEEALRRKWRVLAIDPRGIGELELSKPGWVFAVSLLLGDHFPWRQGWDIRRAAAAAGSRTALYARGHAAALAAAYALAGGGPFEWAVLRDGFLTYRHFINRGKAMEASYRLLGDDLRGQRKTAFDREIPHHYFPFGALEAGDLPDLLAASSARVTVVDPIGGDWVPLPSGAARQVLRGRARLSTVDDWLNARW